MLDDGAVVTELGRATAGHAAPWVRHGRGWSATKYKGSTLLVCLPPAGAPAAPRRCRGAGGGGNPFTIEDVRRMPEELRYLIGIFVFRVHMNLFFVTGYIKNATRV